MKVELIYLTENKCSNLESLFKKISEEPLLCFTKTSMDEFLEALEQAFVSSELIVIVGGFYTGGFSLPQLIIEQYELSSTTHKTTRESFFDGEIKNSLVLPSIGYPLYDDNGAIFGAVIESEHQKMILLSESLSEGEYSYAAEVEAYLEKTNLINHVIPQNENQMALENDTATVIAQTIVVEKIDVLESVSDFELDFIELPDEKSEQTLLYPKKKSRLKVYLFSGLASIILLAAGFFAYNYFNAYQAYDDQNRALTLEYGEVAAGVPTEILDKFGSLFKLNSDIGGWMIVPNTQISYPVMTARKNNNTYYSNHLFGGKSNKFGTPYFSQNYKKNDFNFNSVIYGNNFGDSRAFSELQKYVDLSFYKTAPLITMDTIYAESDWKVFSVIITDLKDKSFNVAENYFFDNDAFASFLKGLEARSIMKIPVDVQNDDELLTLITSYSGLKGLSVAITARKVRVGEEKSVDTNGASVNMDAIYPKLWYTLKKIPNPQTETSNTITTQSTTGTTIITTTQPPTIGITTTTKKGQTTTTTTTTEMPIITNEIQPTIEVSATTSRTTTRITTTKAPTTKTTTKVATTRTTTKTTVKTNTTVSTTRETTTTTKAPTTTKATTTTTATPVVKISVKNSNTNLVVTDEPVKIVAMIIEAEMSSSFNLEALKAQAVASFTYVTYQISRGYVPVAPMKTAGSRATQAANAVKAQLVKYNGAICNTVYSATSAGRSAKCKDVWGGDLPYLISVDSSVDKNASGFQTTRVYKAADVASYVKSQYSTKDKDGNVTMSADLTKIADKTKWFALTYDTNNLYVNTVKIGTYTTTSGINFRYNLFTVPRVGSANLLRSHAFTVSYSAADDKFTFTVKGYGHGVGMSQTGANFYAGVGWDYKKILTHYYSGTTVS